VAENLKLSGRLQFTYNVMIGRQQGRNTNAGNALCLDCHTPSSHKGVNCAICHGTHGTGNLYDVRGRLGTPGGYADVTFTSMTAMGGSHGVCTVCHTTTMYHNVTSIAPVDHYDNQVCVDCHPHRTGFPSFTTVWNPVKRWFAGLLATDTAYAKPPAWVTDGTLPPGLANHSIPSQAWENGLKKFKVSFEIVRKAAAQQSSQGAIKDDIIYYYHNDHLGTPCFLTDETGAIVWRREQTPFGVTSFERGTTTENLRFPGQYWDEETGLAQNWHRDYRAGLGRYVEADPIRLAGGVNSYEYSSNNPINWIDPAGLTVQLCCREIEVKGTKGKIAHALGLKHCFIKTDTKEAGMGDFYERKELPSNPYGIPTKITDHTGQSLKSDCHTIKDVDEDCVNRELQIGKYTGEWGWSNNCNTLAKAILNKCTINRPRCH
jgi:RHS repeat-associated protein